MRIPRMAYLVMLIAFAFSQERCKATERLRSELSILAESVTKVLRGQGQNSIAIGHFTGPPTLPTSAGPGIVKILSDEFSKRGITVKRRDKVALKGEYSFSEIDSDDGKLLAIRLTGSLVDSLGSVITEFDFEGQAEKASHAIPSIEEGRFAGQFRDEETLLHLTGLSVSLPPTYPEVDRNYEIRNRLLDPSCWIEKGTQLSAERGSPYAIEITVNGQPRPLNLEDDLPFVSINRNENYQVRVINRSDYDAAVVLAIDGLNSFEFSELRTDDGRPSYRHYIVPKQGSYSIEGWHRNNKRVDKFLVSRFAESAVADLLRNGLQQGDGIGMITVTFAAAWPTDEQPPADERSLRRGVPENATARGAAQYVRLKEVRRHVGVIRSAISVRYSH